MRRTIGDAPRVAVYVRGRESSSCDQQEALCREILRQRGWTAQSIYRDVGASRWQQDRMVESARRRDLDVIATAAVDRLGRSAATLAEVVDLPVTLVTADAEYDLADPDRRFMLTVTAGVAPDARRRIH